MQRCGYVQQLDGIILQFRPEAGVFLEFDSQRFYIILGALDVAAGLGVTVFGQSCQAFYVLVKPSSDSTTIISAPSALAAAISTGSSL